MKKLLTMLAFVFCVGVTNGTFACAHVDINDSNKAVIFDNFVQDIRDDNYVHIGEQIGLIAEMRGDITKKAFVYVPETKKLYRLNDIQLIEATKDYDLRWIPYLQGCFEHAKAKVEKEKAK